MNIKAPRKSKWSKKMALTACMRKLITRLNAIVRHHLNAQNQPCTGRHSTRLLRSRFPPSQ
ncbi:hypothetical protein BCEP4_1820009 [Burkholderia cepacia]|nr:hypothetical protein DF023_16035 [Burkholderia cepacia]RQU03491.1 hypothetical protein DF022_17435 [Burkholderia cepacia]RQZ80000.1 hypothetical protein DF056_16550 [Burkholderia cepacia]RRA02193.1 hypothetical protein DF055_19005 [Burkholderia cepacia]RRA05389.1 hypothetical protein DF054_21805 [Burkholderia cepacia]